MHRPPYSRSPLAPLTKGRNLIKVPLLKGDLGGSNQIMGRKTMAQLTDQEIEAQIDAALLRTRKCETANQLKIDAIEPRANRVSFEDGRITINFNNGATFSFLAESVEAIARLSPLVLATVELTPSGKGLRWDEPDIDLSIQGLLLGIFGSNVWMKEIAVIGSSRLP